MAPKFDRELFDEAIHYIAWRMRNDDRFGRTKVAKTMFYADFDRYATEGVPLTGARYEHWPQGPFTPEIYGAEKRLVQSGLAMLKEAEFQYDEAKLSADTFEAERLEPWQQYLLDRTMDEVAEQGTAGAVSDRSHEHPGWLVTKDREEIPYYTVHISREGPTRADVEAAERVARQHGWV